jgi:hypothetical protein
MQFTKLACSWVCTAATASRLVSAFRPTTTPRSTRMAFSSLHANVKKLTDPQTELLDNVDVFIFDCDGVIWRVCLSQVVERSLDLFYLDGIVGSDLTMFLFALIMILLVVVLVCCLKIHNIYIHIGRFVD